MRLILTRLVRSVKLAKYLLRCAVVLGTIFTASSGHATEPNRQPGPIEQISAAAASGRLSYETAVLYKVRAICRPELLPEPFRSQALSTPIRCGTPIVAEARQALPTLSAEAQDEIQALFSRPPTDSTYKSPGGHFLLHYDLDSTNAVSAADNDLSGFPDFIERLALYLDSSWSFQIDLLGWRQPPSDGAAGGDSLYDVYPTSIGLTYGFTVEDSPGPEAWDDYSSFILLNKSFLGFPPNDDPESNQIGSMKVTCTHEFNHACQFATNALHLHVTETWWQELSATWIEDVVFDNVNDNYNYLDEFYSDPGISLFDGGVRKYGAFGFAKVMEEVHDTAVVREAWELMTWLSARDAVDSALSLRGRSLSGMFSLMSEWNYFTNTRDDGLHFSEGAAYPLMPFHASHATYPLLNRAGPTIQQMSTSYIEFLPDPAGRDVVEIEFSGVNGVDWRPVFVRIDSSGVSKVFEFPINPVTGDGVIYMGHLNDMARGVLVGTNADWPNAGSDYTYSLRFLRRADCDDDADADVFDMLYLIEAIFAGGPAPVPAWQVGDLNCSGGLDVLDVSIAIDYILKNGDIPCAPFD